MISHIVMFRFADPEDRGQAATLLRGMAGRIPALRSVRVGLNQNTAPHAFDLVLITEHDDTSGLTEYQQHLHHRDVAGWLSHRVSERAVVDADALG